MKTGLVQIYTGARGHINYAPYGLALRACGRNLRTLIMGFSPADYWGSLKRAASFLTPYLIIEDAFPEGVKSDRPSTLHRLGKGFYNARKWITEGRFDMVILDGILPLVAEGVLKSDDLLQLMGDKPPWVEVVLTGFGADRQLIQHADLVTEMVVSKDKEDALRPDEIGPRGSIEIVTGNGKGKTTYCLGKAMLAACSGHRVFVLQVIKSPRLYGEIKGMKRLPDLTVRTMGEGFLDHGPTRPGERHQKAARKAWAVWLKNLYSMRFDLLVLDEINIATHYGLIPWEQVKEMLLKKPKSLHLLLSGREAHPGITKTADIVMEMKEVKHPYQKGIRAREGIEF